MTACVVAKLPSAGRACVQQSRCDGRSMVDFGTICTRIFEPGEHWEEPKLNSQKDLHHRNSSMYRMLIHLCFEYVERLTLASRVLDRLFFSTAPHEYPCHCFLQRWSTLLVYRHLLVADTVQGFQALPCLPYCFPSVVSSQGYLPAAVPARCACANYRWAMYTHMQVTGQPCLCQKNDCRLLKLLHVPHLRGLRQACHRPCA